MSVELPGTATAGRQVAGQHVEATQEGHDGLPVKRLSTGGDGLLLAGCAQRPGANDVLVSDRHKFAFIHIYKVAGTSIRSALAPYAPPSLLGRISRGRLGSLPAHLSAQEARQRLGADRFDSLFTFAFVRNPWDWQVSLYQYMLNERDHRQHETVKQLGSFDRYIEWRVREDRKTQSAFVTDDDGDMLVDFIGRYETVHEDFAEVCRTVRVDASLPHLNASRTSRDYRGWYTPRTRDLVGDCFAEDVERFGYDF